MTTNGNTTLSKKDFKSDQEVRWCPGCGDYAILNCVQGVMADLGMTKENTVVVSGIGCSSRFPYYMDTYGFHSIHGRAPAIASGIKLANPELTVWLVTGDGDGLSIGGNHLIHLLRRNVNIKVLLFNNEIYGLTKGQYSPTSRMGLRTKATPYGSVDRPFDPISLALGAGATFAARTIDTHQKHMEHVFKAAAAHRGAAFIEIFQNCVIFNDGVFDEVADKKVRAERTIELHAGKPMVFGGASDKGLRVRNYAAEVCSPEEADVWNPSTQSAAPSMVMSEIHRDVALPTPLGVLRQIERPVYDESIHAQIDEVTAKKGPGGLRELIYSGDTWVVD